jgi:hypothetical protein
MLVCLLLLNIIVHQLLILIKSYGSKLGSSWSVLVAKSTTVYLIISLIILKLCEVVSTALLLYNIAAQVYQ